ncbi:MAG TPA: MarP family serine protease [Actinomycetes bacterium]|nr:MarP family serine protease [Actinomycetes bacterium]
MTGFDIVVLVLLPLFVWAGYQQGLMVSAFSFGGFLLGVVLGLTLVPHLLGGLEPGLLRAGTALALVLFVAALVQSLASFAGRSLRAALSHGPSRQVDRTLGAIGAGVLVCLSAWLLGEAAGDSPSLPFSESMHDSTVVRLVGEAVPVSPQAFVSAFAGLVADSGFPSVFGDAIERIAPVAPPDPTTASEPGVRAAEASVVKVVSDARACHASLEGSGFVVSAGRVMTNAHVVAGSDRVRVYVEGVGRGLDADVVVLDPRTDVAVLDVHGMSAAPLSFAGTAGRGDAAVVAGFPEDGPLATTPARVRGVLVAVGRDIHGRPGARREVYSLRASVREGNSGGPLLSPSGSVLGLVFAASLDDPQTGYALTAKAVAPALAAGRSATTPVATGACAR